MKQKGVTKCSNHHMCIFFHFVAELCHGDGGAHSACLHACTRPQTHTRRNRHADTRTHTHARRHMHITCIQSYQQIRIAYTIHKLYTITSSIVFIPYNLYTMHTTPGQVEQDCLALTTDNISPSSRPHQPLQLIRLQIAVPIYMFPWQRIHAHWSISSVRGLA